MKQNIPPVKRPRVAHLPALQPYLSRKVIPLLPFLEKQVELGNDDALVVSVTKIKNGSIVPNMFGHGDAGLFDRPLEGIRLATDELREQQTLFIRLHPSVSVIPGQEDHGDVG